MVLKKIFIGIIIGLFLAAAATAFGDEKPIKIILDGREINSDVPPQIINGRTFVPIRVVSEALGMDVKWNAETRAVILTSSVNMPDFSVVSYNKVDTEYGYTILGEVKNRSNKTFSKAEIKAEVRDSSGNVIETLNSTLPPGITTGETAYFRLRSFSGKGDKYNSANFTFVTSDECSVTPADVIFNDVRFSRDTNILNDFTYVTGEIERSDKDNTRKYNHPFVQVALFDKNGKMINYGEKSLDNFETSKYNEFKITLEKGQDHTAYKLKLFSD